MNKINSQREQRFDIELYIEKPCSFEELNISIAKSLKLQPSQVAVYSDTDDVDSHDVVVVKVRESKLGFRQYIEIVNTVCFEHSLYFARSLSVSLQTRILVEAIDIVPASIMFTAEGQLSYVRELEYDHEYEFVVTLSANNPSRPFYSMYHSELHPEGRSIEAQSKWLIDVFAFAFSEGFSEVNAEYRVSIISGYDGQISELFILGTDVAGESVFMDIENITDVARKLESICILAEGTEGIGKNAKFRITNNSVELEQDSPGQAYCFKNTS